MSGNNVVATAWQGEEVLAKARRAQERALVSFGYTVSQTAKTIVHRVTGTLSRSIHLAQDGYAEGDADFENAGGGTEHGVDLAEGQGQMTELVTWDGMVGSLLVGSWIVYAHRQEGLYPYMQPALEQERGGFQDRMRQAFAEEGF